MIVDERLVTYINSLDRGNTPVLDEIEKEALRDFVPIIRKEMQSFLKLLLAMQKPMRILEVGTAVGFSAVLMAEYAPKGCQIVTIENYEKRIPIAKANFKRAGKQEQITLLEGDATEILPQLEGQFDMIFMDAAKGQYINFMPQVLRLLKTGLKKLLMQHVKNFSPTTLTAMKRAPTLSSSTFKSMCCRMAIL